jgi:hypothetical protein
MAAINSGEAPGGSGKETSVIDKTTAPPRNASSTLKMRIDERDQPRNRKSPTAVVIPQAAKKSARQQMKNMLTFEGVPGCAL